MASPFNIIPNNGPAIPPPSPTAHPRPDWLRVKFFGGDRYQDLKRIMRTLDLHTVCEIGALPQHGRVLGTRHRHVHDSGRHLHASLRLLRCTLRQTGRSPGRTRA